MRKRNDWKQLIFLQLLFFLPTSATASVVQSATASNNNSSTSVYRYNICNGLSNQLLYHAASIAHSIQIGARVEIPNHFIVHGVQLSDANVIANEQNSIPLDVVFNATRLLRRVAQLGAVDPTFVTFDFENYNQLPCAGMESLLGADPDLMLDILKAFRPSVDLQDKIQSITTGLQKKNVELGVCVHHRDGQDWKEHCARWGSIPDGIYRGNCLGVPGRTFLQSLEDRGLEEPRWIYYSGDHSVPMEIKKKWDVVTRDELLTSSEIQSIQNWKEGQPIRDIWALIDFSVCAQMKFFIGNSVSTFSALQIALREGENAFWYNSQSIPLGSFFKVFHMPIVYTYTELSASSGKKLLQASIVSVRRHMPKSKVHILYHGKDDYDFRLWLSEHGVIIHQHEPTWKDKIEEMRRNGDPRTSHLFLHAGNYFGTWQRIDIPFAVNSEYVLLLDADTIMLRPFTLADFGMNIPPSIAMSSEFVPDDKPMNAGVTLFNVPRMRNSYSNFLRFIMAHVENPKYSGAAPSDQGAYLEFYETDMRFLSRRFNFKPYWNKADVQFQDPFIAHFHGAKPSEYIKHIMGEVCGDAVRWLCEKAKSLPTLCTAMKIFAESSREVGEDYGYCKQSFHDEAEQLVCVEIMEELVANDNCTDLPSVIRTVLSREAKEIPPLKRSLLHLAPPDAELMKRALAKRSNFQNDSARESYVSFFFSAILPWCVIATTVYYWSDKLRKKKGEILPRYQFKQK